MANPFQWRAKARQGPDLDLALPLLAEEQKNLVMLGFYQISDAAARGIGNLNRME